MRQILYAFVLFSFFSCKENSTTISGESSELFYNGDIITMEEDTPKYVEAVVIQNGKIVFVGSKPVTNGLETALQVKILLICGFTKVLQRMLKLFL